MNILVGAKNAGKSTTIAAFRALAVALRVARSKNPVDITVDGISRLGWHLPDHMLPLSMENVRTNYGSDAAKILFHLSSGDSIGLAFPEFGPACVYVDCKSRTIRTAAQFKKEVSLRVGVVPVLGPVEHEEPLVALATVQRNLDTHRASRNFRNYWFQFPEKFDDFAALVAATWPGLSIQRPETVSVADGVQMMMMCAEDRIDRELYWIGFGFQIAMLIFSSSMNPTHTSIQNSNARSCRSYGNCLRQ